MCTVVTLPSHQLSSFLSSLPSPFPFLFHAQWKCLVRCPPFQKLFHPCLHSFKNCFLHPPSVLVFICAGPLDLPRLKKKRQRKPATASFTCFFSSPFSHLLSPLHFFYYYFCYYYYHTSNKLPNQILLLICHSQYHWRSQREGKRYSEHPFAISAEPDTYKKQIESISKANEGLFTGAKENDQIDTLQVLLDAFAIKAQNI